MFALSHETTVLIESQYLLKGGLISLTLVEQQTILVFYKPFRGVETNSLVITSNFWNRLCSTKLEGWRRPNQRAIPLRELDDPK